MASIEKVTSVKKQVTNKETGKKTTVKVREFVLSVLQPPDCFVKPCCAVSEVWNDTVANLTLMALGSSAPEILWCPQVF